MGCQKSSITLQRINKLNSIGFSWLSPTCNYNRKSGTIEESFESSYDESLEQEEIYENVVEMSMTRDVECNLTTDTNQENLCLQDVVENKTIAGQEEPANNQNLTTSTYIDAIASMVAFVDDEASHNEANKVNNIFQGVAKSPSITMQNEKGERFHFLSRI